MGKAAKFLELHSHQDRGRSPISIFLPLAPEPRATPHMVHTHSAQTGGNLKMILPTVADNLGYTFLKMKSHWGFVLI